MAKLTGDDGANTITGRDHHDHILGLGRDDVLAGGPGKDEIDGASGTDNYLFSRRPQSAEQIFHSLERRSGLRRPCQGGIIAVRHTLILGPA